MTHGTCKNFRIIKWTALSMPEDLDYADDIVLLAQTHQHIQEKTSSLHTICRQIGLNIKKSEIIKVITIKINDQNLTEQIIYLGCILTHDGGMNKDDTAFSVY